MTMITISGALIRCSIDPTLGAGIADFSVKGPTGYFYPLMRRAAPGEGNASLLGSFIMAPWVNRIASGKFTWNGRECALATNTADGMAQHGDVRKRPWRVLSQTPTSVSLRIDSREFAADAPANWPWAFACECQFSVEPVGERGGALAVALSVENVDRQAWPAGCGLHPYFMRRLWNDRDVLEVCAPVAGRYPLERGCAVGAAGGDPLVDRLRRLEPVSEGPLDAVLGGFAGEARLRWPASGVTLTIRASPELDHLVVFAPHASPGGSSPLSFVAVEPQSHVNDALNLVAKGLATARQAGVRVLRPGERLSTLTRFEVDIDGA